MQKERKKVGEKMKLFSVEHYSLYTLNMFIDLLYQTYYNVLNT